MKRKVTEFAHECPEGHWSWSQEEPLGECPHMVQVKGSRRPQPCPGVPVVKGHKQVTVEEDT